MSRTAPSDQLRTLQPLPVPEDEYDLDQQRTARRQIEQNFQSIASNLEETRRLTDREAIYADIEMNWITSCCCCSELSDALTSANLEEELEALTTTDLDMSGVDQLQIGDSLVFTGNTTDWTIDGSTAPLLFSFGATEVFRIDPNSERVQIRDSAGNLRVQFYGLDSTPAMLLEGPQPTIYLNEDDADTNEGWMSMGMIGGQFRSFALTDAGSFSSELFLFNRNGDEWDFGELNVADMRRRTNTYAAADVSISERYYTKGGGTYYFERRREPDSALAWRFLSNSGGDFNLQNYAYSGSLLDTWITGDASTGDFTIGTGQVGSNVILDPESFVEVDSQIIQTGGTTVQVTTSGFYTVPWNDGWAFTIYVTDTTTVDVDGSECRQSGMYLLQVTNDSGASRTVSISGVDFWENAAPTTTLSDDRTHVVALYVVASRSGSFSRVVGHTLVNNSFLI